MKLIIPKIIVVILCIAVGFVVFNKTSGLLGLIIGFICGLAILAIEIGLVKLSSKKILSGTIGLTIGLLIAALFAFSLSHIFSSEALVYRFITVFLVIGLGYLGVFIGYKKRESFSPYISNSEYEKICGTPKILDTSVIIDGRITDICKTYFLEGTLIIPKFVLEELQHIADSADSLKRNRGRRGLEILKGLQEQDSIYIRIDDTNFPELKEVDSKLVKLATEIDGKILTNDFNLNKVAELHGVTVLNINDLANALKPVVLPNEEMKIHLMKRGKEYDQGIGYLEDGTMVVVDNARNWIGKSVTVLVTSVIQTAAGRMIFSKLKEGSQNNNYDLTGE